MNSLCATGSGMSGLTSGVAISGIPAPTGFTVNNSISIPLDSDPDLVLHYPLNGDILNYTGSTPTTGTNDAVYGGYTAYIKLSNLQSIFKNGQSLSKTIAPDNNAENALRMDNSNILFVANTKGYSFSCWFYQTSNSGMIWSVCRDNINFNTSNNNQNKYGVYYTIGAQGLQLIAVPAGAGAVLVTKTFLANPVSNQWYHVVWTLNTSGQSNVFVNGTQVLTNDTTIPYFSIDMKNKYLLGDTNSSGSIFGYMNDFRYYNRILDIYEVKQLFNIFFNNIFNPTYTTPSSNFYLNKELALYYPFNNNLTNFKTGTAGTLTGSTALNYSIVKVGTGSLYNSTASTTNYFTPAAITNTRLGWTFSCWIYLSSTPTSTSAIWFFGIDTANSTGGQLYLTITNNLQLFMNQGIFSGGNNPLVSKYFATITTTQWYHVVITADNVNNTIYYINSVNIGNTPGTAIPFLNSFGISNAVGAMSRNSLFGINAIYNFYITKPINYPGMPGYIDDFRVYNRPLTQSEITMLYSYNNFPMSTLNLNTDPFLCLYYTFDLSTNTVYNYAQNVYGTVDASYVNGAHTNYTDLSYVGTGGLKLLDTNSGYVQLQPTSVVNTTNFISNNGMTFACWFYSKSSLSNAKIFDFNDTYDSYNTNIFVSINASNSISANVYTSPTTSSTVSLDTNYNNSILYHFVWTMSYSNAQTSTWNIYINATNVSNTTSKYYPNQVARGSDFLGRSNIYSDPSFNGYIDDFRVYQRVLTQTEITQIYTYNNTLNVKSANLSWTAANTSRTPLTYNYKYAPYYSSGLSWKAFYGNSGDNSSYLYYAAGAGNSSTNYNTFQNNSWYVGGANTLSSNSTNVLTEIRYSYNTIANTNNIFGFSNNFKIALSISGYFKPDVTGIWTFQFGISTGNDDMSIFWIDDGANVNGTTIHWPPTDNNSNFVSNSTITIISNSAYATTLTAGVYYPIQLNWGQNTGGSILALYFKSPGGFFIYNGSGYFFYQQISSSTPINTSSTNSVINNLLDGNGITYSVNSQVGTKQSTYVSITK